MIERYVRGHRYLSVPGGRLEPGESPEQAALREIEEELGLQITLSGRLPDYDGQAYFLAVVPEEVELRMSGPEMRHSNRNNRYTPRWVDAATLDGLPLRQPVRPLVVTAAIAVAATVPVAESAVRSEIESEVESKVTSKLESKFEAELESAVTSAVGSKLGTLTVESAGTEDGAAEPGPQKPEKPAKAKAKPSRDDSSPIDLTSGRGPLDLPLLEPRAEFDPAAATFAFGQALRRRFVFRARFRSREDRREDSHPAGYPDRPENRRPERIGARR